MREKNQSNCTSCFLLDLGIDFICIQERIFGGKVRAMKFVIGVPRSGTSFFSHLLNAAGPVSVHEHLISLTGFEILKASKEFSEGKKTADQIRHLVRCYKIRPEIQIDCNFVLTHVLPVILEEFPDSKFIHLTRGPADNVRSCINQLDFYGNFFENLKSQEYLFRWFVTQNMPWLFQLMKEIHESCPSYKVPNWETMTQLEKNCIYWRESHGVILDTLSNKKNYMRVKLEDFKTDEGLVENIFSFFDLPKPKPEKIQRILHAPVNSSDDPMWAEFSRIKKELGIPILPKFSEWSQQEKEILVKTCGPIAGELGYEIL
jgi:hypothetical protein